MDSNDLNGVEALVEEAIFRWSVRSKCWVQEIRAGLRVNYDIMYASMANSVVGKGLDTPRRPRCVLCYIREKSVNIWESGDMDMNIARSLHWPTSNIVATTDRWTDRIRSLLEPRMI